MPSKDFLHQQLRRLKTKSTYLTKNFAPLGETPAVEKAAEDLRSPSWRRQVKRLLGPSLIGLVVVGLVIFMALLVLVVKDLPSPGALTSNPVAQSTKIYDRNGELLYSVYESENRTVVPFEAIPQYVREATIAIEDKNFYQHGGVDILGGMLRAVRDTVITYAGRIVGRESLTDVQGGSTITQQLIKMSLLSNEQTLIRKIREAILALWIERIYTKDEILTHYLNRVPYGGTAYGIEEASRVYFGKHAKDLTLAEASLLAGLPQAPTYYSPFGVDPSRAVARQHLILDRMVQDKYITEAEAEAARNQEIIYATDSANIRAPHFVAFVNDYLVTKYGEEVVQTGGLQVTTTLDIKLQDDAQASLSAQIERQKNLKVGNGGALVTRPPTGEILVMVGGKDYNATDGGKVNVTLARRSPGSSIKPLNVALGFLKGNSTPATPWIDARFCFPPFQGKSYCPNNYDGKFHGVTQTRFALGESLNIPAVKQLAANTVEDFIATASAMGLTTFNDDPNRYGFSLALGGGEVKMIDMATAYGVLANQGKRVDLTPILKIQNGQGEILEDNTEKFANAVSEIQPQPWDGTKPWAPYDDYVLPSEVTYLVSHILLDDGARQGTFGANSILNVRGFPVSVKTGTAEDKRDNWTVGYTPSYLTVVWVGNNDNSPMSQSLESGNTGAAPIWNNIMSLVLKGTEPDWPQKPENVVFIEVCSLSGMLPANDCPKRGEYFIKGMQPKDPDNVWNQKRKVLVFKDSGKQPGPNDKPTPDQLEERDQMVISDPFQKDYCIDCPL